MASDRSKRLYSNTKTEDAEPKSEARADERKGEAKHEEKAATDRKDERKGEDESVAARHARERADLHKRHSVERREAHGDHRDRLAKMVDRHEQEITALQNRQGTEMAGTPEDGMAAGGPAGQAAPAAVGPGEPAGE